MKLSSVDVIAEKRARLKKLRAASDALIPSPVGCRVNVKAWFRGEEIDFCDLLSRVKIKSALANLVEQETGELMREIEAHGVVIDE